MLPLWMTYAPRLRAADFLKMPALGNPFGRLAETGPNLFLPTVPTATYPCAASHAKLLDEVNQLSTAMRWFLLCVLTVFVDRSFTMGQHVADTPGGRRSPLPP